MAAHSDEVCPLSFLLAAAPNVSLPSFETTRFQMGKTVSAHAFHDDVRDASLHKLLPSRMETNALANSIFLEIYRYLKNMDMRLNASPYRLRKDKHILASKSSAYFCTFSKLEEWAPEFS